MSGAAAKSILADTVLFCRALRESGIAVTPAEAVAADEPDTLDYRFYRLDEPHAFAVFESFTGPEGDVAHQANPASVPIIERMIACMDGTYTREYLHNVAQEPVR